MRPTDFSNPAGCNTAETETDTLLTKCTGLQPMSYTWRMANAANFGVVILKRTSAKFAALAIRKVYDIGWRPVHFVNNVSVSVSAVLQPAGLEKSVGLITANYGMDPTDPQWQNDPNMREYFAWLKKYFPEGNPANINISYAYGQAYALVDLLKRCRDDLSRDNVMKQATSIRNLRTPLLLPGIAINTNPGDRFGIKQMQLQKFDGKTWVLFGDLISE